MGLVRRLQGFRQGSSYSQIRSQESETISREDSCRAEEGEVRFLLFTSDRQTFSFALETPVPCRSSKTKSTLQVFAGGA